MVESFRPAPPDTASECPDALGDTSPGTPERPEPGRPGPRLSALPHAPEDEDGWHESGGTPARQRAVDRSKKVMRSSDRRDQPFPQSLDPYRGCELGCVYCCARASHGGLGHALDLDFETRIFHKPHAARLLRRKLGKPGYTCQPTAIGANTDAYQPAESELQLTRGLLEVLYELRHPVTLLTKSALVLRDRELLAIMARAGLAQVLISMNTLDADLARVLEPRAATPQARLDTIRALSEAGIPVGVVLAPVIPGLTDREIEELLAAAREAGARGASHTVLRLPHSLLAQFDQWLLWHAPKPVSRLLAMLYGKYGCKGTGRRAGGLEHFAELLDQRFRHACKAIGFPGLPALNTGDFRAPPKVLAENEAGDEQGRLF